jgi:hypothetical protein
MGGHFVPNISFGAVIVQSLRPVTRLLLESHLMISNPGFFPRVVHRDRVGVSDPGFAQARTETKASHLKFFIE